MPVQEGIQQYSRDFYNSYLVSNLFKTFPLGQVLLKENADRNKLGQDIGIPQVKEVVSGNPDLNASQLTTLATAMGYFQDFHTSYTDNSKTMGERDYEAAYPNATTDSNDLHYGNAEWRRWEFQTPMTVWHGTVSAARSRMDLSESDKARAVLDIFGNAIKETHGIHVTRFSGQIFSGMPSNQDLSKWDNIIGFNAICSSSNTYARLNRALASNLQWRGNRYTSSTSVALKDQRDYAAYSATLGNGTTGGLKALGRESKLKLAVAGSTIFQYWRNECESRGDQIIRADQDPMGAYGLTGEIVRYSNTLAICDQNMPANSSLFLDPADVTIAFETGKQMTPSNWKYLPDYAEGAQQRYSGTMTSAVFFIHHNPLNAFWYSNVSTS